MVIFEATPPAWQVQGPDRHVAGCWLQVYMVETSTRQAKPGPKLDNNTTLSCLTGLRLADMADMDRPSSLANECHAGSRPGPG